MSQTDTTPAIVPFVDTDELLLDAYESAYERPITLTADGGVHADSMPRVRAFAGNTDRGYGTYTESETVAVETFPHKQWTHFSRIPTERLVDDVARAMITATRDKHEGRDPNPERAL